MRIGDLVNTTLAAAAISAVPQRSNRALDALHNRGNGSGSERGIATPRIAAPTVESPEAPAAESKTDTLELSGLSPTGAPAAPPAGDKQASSSALAGLVEKFIRKRAIIAYSQPARTPNGPSLDFVMEVEIAYRVIEPLQPGQTLDIQA